MDRQAHPYENLTPETVIAAVESLGYVSDARILTLNSYENRVYQVGIEDAQPVIVKFYRPGRWSNEQILEEHDFVHELHELEIPSVPPLVDDDGNDVPEGTPGEALVRGRAPHVIFEGYFDNPGANAASFKDGWFRTGDLLRRDPDGDYYFVDRKKDSIRSKGRNISTIEVEQAVSHHPAIARVAAYGVTCEHLDAEEELALAVVLKEGTELTAPDLARFINDNAPYFFVPRYIEFVDSLPYTPTNKVQKFLLRERGISDRTWDRKAAGFELKK